MPHRLPIYSFIAFMAFLLGDGALAAPSSEWSVIKSKNLVSLSSGAVLRSVKVVQTPATGPSKEAHIEGVLFPSTSFRLQVIDHPPRDKTASQILQEYHYLAGVNGGYFHPNGTPLGLLMHHGKVIHPQEKARLLSGFFVATRHKMALLRVSESLPTGTKEVLQAGPFLIDHGNSVIGLETTRVARRTFLATDGHGLWLMGVISPTTLAEASRVLLAAAPQFFSTHKIKRALNLDGGSSSALWVAHQPEAYSQSEFGHVRNFLGLKLRK